MAAVLRLRVVLEQHVQSLDDCSSSPSTTAATYCGTTAQRSIYPLERTGVCVCVWEFCLGILSATKSNSMRIEVRGVAPEKNGHFPLTPEPRGRRFLLYIRCVSEVEVLFRNVRYVLPRFSAAASRLKRCLQLHPVARPRSNSDRRYQTYSAVLLYRCCVSIAPAVVRTQSSLKVIPSSLPNGVYPEVLVCMYDTLPDQRQPIMSVVLALQWSHLPSSDESCSQ